MRDDELLEREFVLRVGHLPTCGEGAEFPWDCTCDYAGFMEAAGSLLDRLRAPLDPERLAKAMEAVFEKPPGWQVLGSTAPLRAKDALYNAAAAIAAEYRALSDPVSDERREEGT